MNDRDIKPDNVDLRERDREFERVSAALRPRPDPRGLEETATPLLRGSELARDTSALGPIAARIRSIAIAALAREHRISEAEAEARLEEPGMVDAEVDHAARRREAENERIVKELRKTGVAVPPEVLPLIVAGRALETDATLAAGKWLRGPRRVLALVGNRGTGKTCAAACVAAYTVRKRKEVVYIRESNLVRLSARRVVAHEEQLEHLFDVPLVIVEELGMSLADPKVIRDAVATLVDHRIGVPEARTILLGNMTAEELVTTYAGRFADRMTDHGVIAEMKGESMRGRA